MKLKLDVPVNDLLTGEQRMMGELPVTIRTLMVRAGSSPHQDDPQKPEDAVLAWTLASRAASVPKDGAMDLDLKEASFIKTRAFQVLFIDFAGPLHDALEAAAEGDPA